MIQVNNLSLVPPIPFLISEGKQITQNLCLMIGNNEFWVDAAISRILDSAYFLNIGQCWWGTHSGPILLYPNSVSEVKDVVAHYDMDGI